MVFMTSWPETEVAFLALLVEAGTGDDRVDLDQD
jgi:hypothetical protein